VVGAAWAFVASLAAWALVISFCCFLAFFFSPPWAPLGEAELGLDPAIGEGDLEKPLDRSDPWALALRGSTELGGIGGSCGLSPDCLVLDFVSAEVFCEPSVLGSFLAGWFD
jgi:hypothetical protein